VRSLSRAAKDCAVDVLQAQIEKYDLDSDTASLHDLSLDGNEIIDYAECFTRNENGDIVFAFGKHKGFKVIDKSDYINWMLSADFTFDTKEKAKRILNGDLI